MTRPVKEPSKPVPSIPVRPNRNAPFHLMYQPNSPGFWVEWKSPHKIDIITLHHLCHSGKTIVLIKSTLYCGTSTLNHLKSGWKTVQFQSRYFRKGGKHLIFESKVIRQGRVSKTWLKIGSIRTPGGVPNKVLYGDTPPRGLSRLYPFLYHFWQKMCPFSYTFYWQMERLSHTYFRTLHPL